MIASDMDDGKMMGVVLDDLHNASALLHEVVPQFQTLNMEHMVCIQVVLHGT